MDKKTLRLVTGHQQGVIQYTMDGSEPTPAARIFRDSLVLTKSTVIKAKTFLQSGMRSATITEKFTKAIPAPPTSAGNKMPGLQATYYEGQWTRMPDFKKPRPRDTQKVEWPDLQLLKTRKEYYAIQFTGYIRIPSSGVYTFSLLSDEVSQLYLDDRQLINNDGCHGDLEKTGEKALASGLHKITINYFQDGTGQSLQVYLQGPGIAKKIIPAELFFRSR